MTDNRKEQERNELHRTIWAIADEMRGSVDGWDFKSYILGILFYRYISENITNYINRGEWESGNTPHQLDLLPGKYVIHEKSVPKGYKFAEDVNFEVADDNTVLSGKVFQATGSSVLLMTVTGGRSAYRHILQAYEKGKPGEKFYVYCINLGKPTPAEMNAYEQEDLNYREDYAGEEGLYKETTNKSMTSAELYEDVLRVLYNGYANDAMGLKEKYNLTTDYYIDATQKAVWHFTDRIDFIERDFTNEPGAYEAYLDLINADNEVPENVSAHMYIAGSDNYQDLVAAQVFYNETIKLSVRNFKEEDKAARSPSPNTNALWYSRCLLIES